MISLEAGEIMEEKNSREYSEELLRIVDAFRQRIIDGTTDPDNFLSITEIEQLWSKLKDDTSLLYSDMLSELLSNADESELIRKKKQNTERKE